MFERFKEYFGWLNRREIAHKGVGYIYWDIELLDLHEIMMLESAIKRFKQKHLGRKK